MRRLGVILAGVLCVVVIWKTIYPTYSYRYRLVVELEVDGVARSGSSVIDVSWVAQPRLPGGGSFTPHVRGQGAFIDLGSRGAIVSTLDAATVEELGRIKWPFGVAAQFVAARAFGNRSTNDELSQLPRLSGRRELTEDNMVPLVWFADIGDSSTARQLRLADIPSALGTNARLATAYVEITDAPVVIDLDRKLPWFRELALRQKTRGVLSRPGEFTIVHTMFVGE